MNIAQAIHRGLIAAAISVKPGPAKKNSIGAPDSAGMMNVRVHEAQLERVPLDYNAEAQRNRQRQRRR